MGIKDYFRSRKQSEVAAENSEDTAWAERMESRKKAGKDTGMRKGAPVTAPPAAPKTPAKPSAGRQPTGSLGEDIEGQIRDIQGKRQISSRRVSRSTGRG